MGLFSSKVSLEAQVLEIVNPVTGELFVDAKGKPYTVSLLGADTNQYKAAVAKLTEESRASNKKLVPREVEKKMCELLAEITTDCYLILDEEESAKPMKFSKEAMADLYFNPSIPWLREQVNTFAGNRLNFIVS